MVTNTYSTEAHWIILFSVLAVLKESLSSPCVLLAHMESAAGCFLTLRLYFWVPETKRPYREVNCGQTRCLFFQMPHCFGQIISYITFYVWENITVPAVPHIHTRTHTMHLLTLTQKPCWSFCAVKILLIISSSNWSEEKVELRIWWDWLWHG